MDTVRVTPSDAEITLGQNVQLAASLADAYGNAASGRTVTWASSQATVATVDSTGLETGVAVGNASITASAEGKTGLVSVHVKAALPEVYTLSTHAVISNWARLVGGVHPNGASTSAWFRVGTDPSLNAYAETSPFDSIEENSWAWAWVGGLSPSTTYYYRFVARNSVGLSMGEIFTITTSPASGTALLTKTGLSGATGSQYVAQVEVPAGLSRVAFIVSGVGDPDLYVRRGTTPTRGDNDCTSAVASAYEVCALDNPGTSSSTATPPTATSPCGSPDSRRRQERRLPWALRPPPRRPVRPLTGGPA